MIWSVSTLSPRTNALPVMTVSMMNAPFNNDDFSLLYGRASGLQPAGPVRSGEDRDSIPLRGIAGRVPVPIAPANRIIIGRRGRIGSVRSGARRRWRRVAVRARGRIRRLRGDGIRDADRAQVELHRTARTGTNLHGIQAGLE